MSDEIDNYGYFRGESEEKRKEEKRENWICPDYVYTGPSSKADAVAIDKIEEAKTNITEGISVQPLYIPFDMTKEELENHQKELRIKLGLENYKNFEFSEEAKNRHKEKSKEFISEFKSHDNEILSALKQYFNGFDFRKMPDKDRLKFFDDLIKWSEQPIETFDSLQAKIKNEIEKKEQEIERLKEEIELFKKEIQ